MFQASQRSLQHFILRHTVVMAWVVEMMATVLNMCTYAVWTGEVIVKCNGKSLSANTDMSRKQLLVPMLQVCLCGSWHTCRPQFPMIASLTFVCLCVYVCSGSCMLRSSSKPRLTVKCHRQIPVGTGLLATNTWTKVVADVFRWSSCVWFCPDTQVFP